MRRLLLIAFALAGLAQRADAVFFVSCANYTTSPTAGLTTAPASKTLAYTYRLGPGVAFGAGETLAVTGVDPAATVSTPFPSFFSVANNNGTVVLTALVAGISGTAPVLEIDSTAPTFAWSYWVNSARPGEVPQAVEIPGPGTGNALLPGPTTHPAVAFAGGYPVYVFPPGPPTTASARPAS